MPYQWGVWTTAQSLSARRAWIEIVGGTVTANPIFPSLSARRAWIEITVTRDSFSTSLVALRKESVDRNTLQNFIDPLKNVALRKESVDRNSEDDGILSTGAGRSPQGERG